jgi:hypothetical protein
VELHIFIFIHIKMSYYQIFRPFFEQTILQNTDGYTANVYQFTLALLFYNILRVSTGKSVFSTGFPVPQVKPKLGPFAQCIVYASSKMMNLMFGTSHSGSHEFMDQLSNSMFKHYRLLLDVFNTDNAYTPINKIASIPIDINGTSDEFLDQLDHPDKLVMNRVPTGAATQEGLPVIDESNPSSYKVMGYYGWQFGFMPGFAFKHENCTQLDPLTDQEVDQGVAEMVQLFGALDDQKKIESEFFSAHSGTLQMPCTCVMIGFILNHVHKVTLEESVSNVFLIAASVLDGVLAYLVNKRHVLSARPVVLIRHRLRDQIIQSWFPGNGIKSMKARCWVPYQPLTFINPPHSEFCSGATVVFTSAATAMEHLFGKKFYDANKSFKWYDMKWIYKGLDPNLDHVLGEFIVPPKSSVIEPGMTPTHPVTLKFETFRDWCRSCAMSRVFSGVHFKRTVEKSESFGRFVGERAIEKFKRL